MRVTLQTIADELGVSRSTVSNAYSRPDQLSPELRSRILEAAERLGYAGPHPSARSLRSGKAGSIGVLMTTDLSMAFRDPYAVAHLRGLAEVAERHETSLLLIPLPRDHDGALRAVRGAAVDGFVVYCVPDWYGALDVIRSRGVPVVVGEDPETVGKDTYFVGIDERSAARSLASHVAALGHRRIAIVAHWVVTPGSTGIVGDDVAPEDLRYFVTGERVRGYRDGFAAVGIGWDEILLINVAGNNREAGEEAAAYALDRLDRATAVLATSDVLALGVLDALAVRGLRPGVDVSVTGFDDIPEAGAAGLTTIRQPSVERGRLAGQLLLDPPDDPESYHRVLPTSLVVRATTGPSIPTASTPNPSG